MRYFSGFGFAGESPLFEEFLEEGEYVVAGFSYGAQQAFEYAKHATVRIQKLQLLSPAFFLGRTEGFIRGQILGFKKDRAAYLERFYRANVSGNLRECERLEPYRISPSLEDLEALLSYEWREEDFILLAERGVEVEVFLGEEDQIIDPRAAFDFFSQMPSLTLYSFKGRSHLLFAK